MKCCDSVGGREGGERGEHTFLFDARECLRVWMYTMTGLQERFQSLAWRTGGGINDGLRTCVTIPDVLSRSTRRVQRWRSMSGVRCVKMISMSLLWGFPLRWPGAFSGLRSELWKLDELTAADRVFAPRLNHVELVIYCLRDGFHLCPRYPINQKE
jgi:hypothetical protein